jgi:hypothetical protein
VWIKPPGSPFIKRLPNPNPSILEGSLKKHIPLFTCFFHFRKRITNGSKKPFAAIYALLFVFVQKAKKHNFHGNRVWKTQKTGASKACSGQPVEKLIF